MQIPLTQLDDIDSTSALAMQWLREGRALPFAIAARHQHAGRGRLGHTWKSGEGALYLSMALPVDQQSQQSMPLLSLHAAVLVAQWLQSHLKFRTTLKWPNDLLFGAAKFGGLLCEADVQGNTTKGLIIGIGVNVREAPQVDDYATTSLLAITGQHLEAAALTESLVEFFAQHWSRLNAAHLVGTFRQFAIESGQLWQLGDGKILAIDSYGSDGALRLTSLSTSQQLELSSAHNAGSWFYQANRQHPVLVADVGNSRTKLAVFAHPQSDTPVSVYAVSDQPAIIDCLQMMRKQMDDRGFTDGPWPLHIGSVNPKLAETLRSQAILQNFVPIEIGKRAVLRRPESSYSLAELGIDRLAAIEAVLAAVRARPSTQPRSYHLIVCAGTATTIDVVRGDGLHLGGRILPGMQLSLESLGAQAAQLPPHLDVPFLQSAQMADNPLLLGHGTVEAMRLAVVCMTQASIELLAQGLVRETGIKPTIYVSGGLGAALNIIDAAQIDPNLILKGLKSLALGGMPNNS